jgi:hypothetical protein
MMVPLLERLLADAEAAAVRLESRQALVLLRWAATIAPRSTMPRVLLAFHRVRGVSATSAEDVPARVELVESDRLGFPVPRFASRAPDLDLTAFVPSPRFAPETIAAGGHARSAPEARSGVRSRKLALLTGAAGLVALLILVQQESATDAAAQALRLGRPKEALVILGEIPEPDPTALVVRGRAHLAIADTQSAVASFRQSLRHPAATGEEVLAAARELANLPCCGGPAADAFILAVERGVASARYPEIADALDRAGRSEQARRVRELGGSN